MSTTVAFERRITVEEADEARILVRADLLPRVQAIRGALEVRIGGRTFDASLVSELCQCAGPSRPHCHHFLLLRGDAGLVVADRLRIEVAARS